MHTECVIFRQILSQGSINGPDMYIPLIVNHPSGGLAGISVGLEKLKSFQVSAAKIVVHPQETS